MCERERKVRMKVEVVHHFSATVAVFGWHICVLMVLLLHEEEKKIKRLHLLKSSICTRHKQRATYQYSLLLEFIKFFSALPT